MEWEAWDTTYEKWLEQTTHEGRVAVMKDLQSVHNEAPTSIPLFYPDEYFAVANTFSGWVETPGYGVLHKWSFLPAEVVEAAHADTSGTVVYN